MILAVRLRCFSKCLRSVSSVLFWDRSFSSVCLQSRVKNDSLFRTKVINEKLLTPSYQVLQVKRFSVSIYDTPNPHSLKFFIDRVILDSDTSPQDFPSSTNACQLVSQIFRVSGVRRVYIGRDFVTVSKMEDAEWNEMQMKIKEILSEYFVINNFVDIPHDQKVNFMVSEEEVEEGKKEVVAMIKELIETKIKPTVQEDGGDIIYMGFQNGVVKVKLQGSCTGCPSSEVTLKRGIQNMLQFYVPEVVDVVQVEDEKDELSNHLFKQFDEFLNNKT